MSAGGFECVSECSQCCIEREYYPSVKFGKIGVLVLPEERERLEAIARKTGTNIVILPRIGISDPGLDRPTKILAYQLMGRDNNGNTCPFLEDEGGPRSPHGGRACRIYHQRPLACRAYPVIGNTPVELDPKCKFCQECGSADSSIDSEVEALVRIKETMGRDVGAGSPAIWRYATGVGDDAAEKGWFADVPPQHDQ